MSWIGALARGAVNIVKKVIPKIARKGVKSGTKAGTKGAKAGTRATTQAIKGAPDRIPRELLIRTKPVIPSTGLGYGTKTMVIPKQSAIKTTAKTGLFPPKATPNNQLALVDDVFYDALPPPSQVFYDVPRTIAKPSGISSGVVGGVAGGIGGAGLVGGLSAKGKKKRKKGR